VEVVFLDRGMMVDQQTEPLDMVAVVEVELVQQPLRYLQMVWVVPVEVVWQVQYLEHQHFMLEEVVVRDGKAPPLEVVEVVVVVLEEPEDLTEFTEQQIQVVVVEVVNPPIEVVTVARES
tara:strand:+ start:196 stop:555 length:360 start_codon:yes stop_codon:yes gene_type:complete